MAFKSADSPVVVDASVFLSLALETAHRDLAGDVLATLRNRPAAVPSLFWQEVLHPILKAVRGGTLPADAAVERIGLAVALPVRTISTGGRRSLRRRFDRAIKHGLSGYDATYLDLAVSRGAELASLDRQLRRAAVAEGVGVIPAEFGG